MVVRHCKQHNGMFDAPQRKGRPPVRCTDEYPCDKAPLEPTRVVEPQENPSLAPAKEAAEKLRGLEWYVIGRAVDSTAAEITATRDDELLVMTWRDGECVSQDYSIWDCDRPPTVTDDAMPDNKLTFDPDEIPDSELVRLISGMKATWWNHLAQREEHSIIGNKITIEHIYNGIGHERSEDRIVKFTSAEGQGFRAFRLGALIKLG